jgi:hypothetical protein
MTCCLLLCQNKTDRNNVVLLLIFLFVRSDYTVNIIKPFILPNVVFTADCGFCGKRRA